MQFNKLYALALLFLLGCNSSEKKNQEELYSHSIIAEHPVFQDALILNQSNGVVYYKNLPFTGNAIAQYDNGVLAISIDYKDGRKDGQYKKFFPNGELSFEAYYTNGKQNGKNRTWWSNGNLRTESNFVDGVPDGVQFQYYKTGQLFKKINLTMGQEEGLQQSWRENGKLYNNYEAKNGRIFGLKRSKLCFKLDDEEVQYE